MALPIRWTWVWVNSRSWWWRGKSGMLQSRVTKSRTWLSNWSELKYWETEYNSISKVLYIMTKLGLSHECRVVHASNVCTHPCASDLSVSLSPDHLASFWLSHLHFGRYYFHCRIVLLVVMRDLTSVGNQVHCSTILMVRIFFLTSHQYLSPWNFCLSGQPYSPYSSRKKV